MTYATEKARMGRQPVYIVEMDLDFCEHVYGVAPCTAALGVTGTTECFNTRKTCQDSTNYSPTAMTYRFANIVLPPSSDLDFLAIPCVTAISMAPTVIDPGNGISKRASVVITCRDFPLSDLGLDPYLSTRGYDSFTRSTYWLKLLARNPYYQNRSLRVKVGYVVDGEAPDPANFETRLYLIQRIDGPDASGMIRITAQDPLKLLDDERAKVPTANTGKLLAAILAGDLSATLTPAGIGDDEYPASGTCVIGEEVITFTRAADALTFTARGVRSTTADGHDADASVQVAKVYEDMAITDILYDLLVTEAGIPSGFVDLSAWEAEAAVWLSDYRIGTCITKPIGVNQLVGELTQQCLSYIWWDERAQEIPFRAIRPTTYDDLTDIDDTNNVLAESQSRTEKPELRKTQVWVYCGQRNPTLDLNKPYNYVFNKVSVDPDAEGTPEYGDSRITVIYSRWLLAESGSEAAKLGLRLLARYRNNTVIYKFKLDAKDSSLWTGDIVHATIRSIIDATGAQLPSDLQILEVHETIPGSEYEYTLQDTDFRGRYAFFAPDDEPDYPDASEEQRKKHAQFCPDSGVFVDGTEGYKLI